MLNFITILAATVGVVAGQPADEAQWHTDYGTALKQTRSDDRPLLMVIDQPGDTKLSLPQDLLDQADGETYDLCHVDAGTKYGKKVAEAFKTAELPYVAFIDKAGKVILHSETGKITTDEFTSLQTKYRTGEKPVRRVAAKPVITSSPVSSYSPSFEPAATSFPTYQSPQPYYPSASPRPYCAKCQRGY